MTKISALPQDTAPTTGDSIPAYDLETTTTKRVTLSDLITLFFNNIPTGSPSPITRHSETMFDFVASGLVWSGDAYASTRAASMTAGVVYINGRRIMISAVTARTFTASKDTYIDILDNADGTGTIVYTEATNNAASSALAANSIRIGIIVTGATTIAAVGSINQGQETKVLPIASSIPYQVTDSLGNLICSRDSNHRVIGYRQITSNFATAATTATQVTGLSAPIIVPTARKIKVSYFFYAVTNSGVNTIVTGAWDGTVGSGAQITGANAAEFTATYGLTHGAVTNIATISAGSHTINIEGHSNAGTTTLSATAALPGIVLIELV